MKLHLAVLNARDGEKVFHEIDEPFGIIVDIRKDLLQRFIIQLPVMGQQIVRVSEYGRKRSADIMGYGSEEVGSELFIPRHSRGQFLLLCVPEVFEGQGAFSENGHHDAVFKRFQRDPVQPDGDHAVAVIVQAYRMILRSGIAVLPHPETGGLLAAEYPPGDLLFIFVRIRCGSAEMFRAELRTVSQVSVILPGKHDDIPVQEHDDLTGGDPYDFVRRFRLLQKLVRVEQDLCPECFPGGVPCVPLHPVGQSSGDQGRDQHDGESHRVFRLICMEAEFGIDKEPVEQQDACEGTQRSEERAYGNDGDHQDPEDENGDDVRFRESELHEKEPCARGRGQNKQGDEKILERRTDLFGNTEPFLLMLKIRDRIRDDIDINVRSVQDNLLRQRRFAPEMPPLHSAPPDYDFCRIGDVGIFRNLCGNVVAYDRRDRRAAVLCVSDAVAEIS